jgi:hypothetical protein
MKAPINRTRTLRIWIPGTIAVLLSIACAFSYFGYIGQGIAVGALLGLPGREADVAIAQHRGTDWLLASLFCFTGSIVTGAVALPFPFYPDASRLSRLVARSVLVSILSVALTVFSGVVGFSIIAALHHHLAR